MSAAEAVAAIMFFAIVAYAILGGADFGSGVWDLIAGDAKRGSKMRRLVDHAIGPVWEANHVWLIFIFVFLWTAFPTAFGALMRDLGVPFWLVGLGVVLRGAGFAFRKFAPTLRWARVAGATFATASLITPFFLGTIVGAIASGRVGSNADVAGAPIWLSPTSLVGGVLATTTCTFLAGVFLAAEADRLGEDELAMSISRRTVFLGVVTGAIALAGVFPIRNDAPTLAVGLTGRASPLVVLSALAGASTIWLLLRAKLRLARLGAVVAVGAVVVGWGVAQYPWVLVDQITIEQGAANSTTLIGLLVISVLSAVFVVPPLIFLFIMADTDTLGSTEIGESSTQAG